MTVLRRWQKVALGALAAIALAGVVLVNPLGRMILEQPLAGDSCDAPDTVEGLAFRSAFNSENQMVNGSMIRSRAGDPGPDCTRIGASYRCHQDGPTVVEVRLHALLLHYDVPAGRRATIFGGPRAAYCVLVPPGGAG